MGAFLEKPKTEKHNESGSGNGLKYGVSSMQGWRVEMEDAHTATAILQDDLKDWSFFAVFDGHAGGAASAHCSHHLLSFIIQSEEFQQAVAKSKDSALSTDIKENIKKAMHGGFLRIDEIMRQMPEVISGHDKSGTTAVCALISPTHMFVANCGDSRAVLCESKGRVCFSTVDHKPVNPEEKARIQNAGGSVMIQRVNGALAVSRALGDFEYKNVEGLGPCEQLVSPEPEIFIHERKDDDEFLVLACDGIWDVMTNENLCEYITSRLTITNDMESIANSVVDTCFYKGSKDNMSLVVIALPGAAKPCDLAIKQEKSLEAAIEKSILAMCIAEKEHLTMSYIISELSREEFNLPPGGGLSAKRAYIESLIKVFRPDILDKSGDKKDGLYNLEFLPSSTMQRRIASLFEKVPPDDNE